MKKNLIILGSILFIFFFVFLSSSSTEEEAIFNPFDYARITDVDYKAVLIDEPDEGGKLKITERLTFDIHAASKDNLFWELWRDLVEDYVDGLKVEYKVNSVKQIYEDGREVIYEESPKLYWDDYDYVSSIYGPGKWYHSKGPYNEDLARYEAVFFYVDGLYREEVVFEIEYEMSNAALRYNDVSELYISMYSEDTIKYLESFKAQILIADKDMPGKGNYEAYTYGTNANSFPFDESDTINPGYHTFLIDLDKDELKFKPYNQYIEFLLWGYNEDSHKFTDYAPNNNYSYTNVFEELKEEHKSYVRECTDGTFGKTIMFIITIGTSVILLITAKNKDKKIRQKYNFFKPTMMMQQYFRDIPSDLDPSFAADLVFCKDNKKRNDGDAYSAILLSLVRKKYVELDRIDSTKKWTNNNIKIVIKYQPVQPTIPTLTETVLDLNNENLDLNVFDNKVTTLNDLVNAVTPTITSTPEVPIINAPTERYNIDGYKLEPLTLTEQEYFNLIKRHAKLDNEISMNTFQTKISLDYDNTDTFVRTVDNSTLNIGISQGYFQKSNYEEPKNSIKSTATKFELLGLFTITVLNFIMYHTRFDLAWGGFTILGIALIIHAHIIRKNANQYILLTQLGEDEYAKWKGLYNFLNSETLMSEKTVIELPIWEKYLVYATAFGISEKVIKAIEIRCPEIQELTPMLQNNYIRSSSFRSSGRSFSSTARSASYTSRSGGGGYGGGGRGGGGGGGGH